MNVLRLVGWALLLAAPAWSQGYRLESTHLSVAPQDWREWNFPQGTLQFGSAGVRPIFVEDRVNAALDAPTFVYGDGVRGGIRGAGTRVEQAGNIADGREDTFWEPEPEAPLEDWWVEIDLGRLVWARKVVVKFAAEGAGDPFLQFSVLTSTGEKAFLQNEALSYLIAGRSEGLNKAQRVFEFDLKPIRDADPGLQGRLFQYLQIVATASDVGRAKEVSQATWNVLPADERGDVLYFRRGASGLLQQMDRSEYEAIADEAERGPVRYYRRERARLAEVEVWTVGDNISLGALDRGGEIIGYGNLGAEVQIVDGNYNTFWSVEVGFSVGNLDVTLQDPFRNAFLDLGAWYWVNRVAILYGDLYSRAFPNYVITLSDGRKAPDGSLSYISLAARGQDGRASNENRNILFQDNLFPLTKARYFKMDYALVRGSTRPSIRELQLYGRGFLPQVSLTSGLIELGRNPRILSTIYWEADTPPGTQVQVRTRTGDQIAEQIHYFTNTGVEVSESRYRKLASFQRGDSLITVIPGADWSNWSPSYPVPGAAITSPSPRRYVMVQATVISDDPDRAALLRQLRLELNEPLADQIVGEIAPATLPQRGQREIFTLFLQPAFLVGNRGFDQVLVELPPGTEVELVDAAVDGQIYDLEALERVESGSDSLWVRLPEALRSGRELLTLRFAGTLYLANNTFATQVGLGEGEERVWQRVDGGEASSSAEGRGLNVRTSIDGGLLGEVEALPNPFTPNGDGINETVELVFPVFRIWGSKILILEVYALDGRRVRRVEEPAQYAAGLQRMVWDGRGDGGDLLPPGLYVCRVGLEVDAGDSGRPIVAKLVASVY